MVGPVIRAHFFWLSPDWLLAPALAGGEQRTCFAESSCQDHKWEAQSAQTGATIDLH